MDFKKYNTSTYKIIILDAIGNENNIKKITVMQRMLQFIIVSVSIAYYIVVFRCKCFFSKILKKAFIQNRTLKRI